MAECLVCARLRFYSGLLVIASTSDRLTWLNGIDTDYKTAQPSITITPDGPYVVKGGIPLSEDAIVPSPTSITSNTIM